MSKLMLNLAGGVASFSIGLVLLAGGSWKTVVEDIASPYTVTERAEYAVQLPPPLRISLQGLGLLTLIGGTLYFADRALGDLEPVLNQCAGSPIDRPIYMPRGPVKTKSVAQRQAQASESNDEMEPIAPLMSPPPSTYSQSIVTPEVKQQPPEDDEWENPTSSAMPFSPIVPETKQQLPEDDEWEPAPKIVVNRFPRPNADLEVTKVPEEVNLLDAAARTELHLLIATKSGAGKTTTILAIIAKINEYLKGKVLFFLIDPKNRNWLGLENVDNTYFTTDDQVVTTPAVEYPLGRNLIPAYRQIENVYNLLVNRISKGQGAHFDEHVYLIIDEWVALYDAILCEKKNVSDYIMRMVRYILTMGREPKVHLILIGQSHLVSDCGFSTKLRQCFAIICQGRVGKNKDVGYDPIEAAIDDRNLINARVAEKLYPQLQEAIAQAAKENDRPVMLSTMGSCRIGLVEDFSGLSEQVIFGNPSPNDAGSDEPEEDEEPLPSDVNYYQSEEYKKSLELARQFQEEYLKRKNSDGHFGAE